ncbi:2-amino-4-hydroxy-6-hydroxymethyldihydropteridinediphosphokinase [Pelagirhabdus alkalitolerans]|uniref:2-amino-4-hydroxy-6-hydroxymethyldihydropteridine diphosphokinase n=1 Tax=Pelagirhabdus alkalitolerans TaxID=1612202 RepID=A0A1G6MG63_9BACI|nr:2-amino-4-hydroxy-6-hydroxymethyldihydropteridine diphosphokinase [Pelagirhabdus alkalitolerans]SDC54441.1 2-amino-4-hydroxy-6-hydroxymethyldihydropteridinediphosphokinase [Pelagirhabdus alkalitolerans]
MNNDAYIALGSNISPRDGYLKQAIDTLHLDESIQVEEASPIYETDPVGYDNQGKFLNQVIKVRTSYDAPDLLMVCQEIERELGRKRDIRWGPRTIDLDILLYNQENMKTEQLILPHPRMHLRAFVLIPLMAIAPELILPTVNKTVESVVQSIPKEEKRGIKKWIK